jgi:hypothetical protein
MSKSEHPDSWALRSGQRMPAEPKAQPPGPVNTHPGPDLDVPELWPDTSRGSERPGGRRGSQRQHYRQSIADGPAGVDAGPALMTMRKAHDKRSQVPDPWRRMANSG